MIALKCVTGTVIVPRCKMMSNFNAFETMKTAAAAERSGCAMMYLSFTVETACADVSHLRTSSFVGVMWEGAK